MQHTHIEKWTNAQIKRKLNQRTIKKNKKLQLWIIIIVKNSYCCHFLYSSSNRINKKEHKHIQLKKKIYSFISMLVSNKFHYAMKSLYFD